jgi:hypothetical protein
MRWNCSISTQQQCPVIWFARICCQGNLWAEGCALMKYSPVEWKWWGERTKLDLSWSWTSRVNLVFTSKNCFSLDSGPLWSAGVTFSILHENKNKSMRVDYRKNSSTSSSSSSSLTLVHILYRGQRVASWIVYGTSSIERAQQSI